MKSIDWEEYLNIPGASDEDIQRVENQLNISFPEEFKQVLRLYQGKIPIPNGIESEEVCQVIFGPIFHVVSDKESPYSIQHQTEFWHRYYPNLLPIADSGDGCIFAYDFSQGVENPPVIFVNAEVDPEDDEEDEGILFVARNLTELLANLKE
jgi:SMI1 / KNR4 family (SUKH-1)